MTRLVVNEELKFGRVKYVSLNRDWAKVIDLHTGEVTFIHVYERGELDGVPHHSPLPFVYVLGPEGRKPGVSVPKEGTIIRFKAGKEPETLRPRALAWVTADEWLECLNSIQQQRWNEEWLLNSLVRQGEDIAQMFPTSTGPIRLLA